MELTIYRHKKGLEPVVLTTTNDFSVIGTWMDIKQITTKVTSPTPYIFRTYSADEYDYVLHGGNKYILFYEPTGKDQNSETKYEYDLSFYGEEILLKTVLLRDVVKSGVENEQEVRYNNGSLVEFFGGAKEFSQRLQANIDNQLGIGAWTVIADVSTEFGLVEKYFAFDGLNCWDALKAFNQDVNINFYVDTTKGNGGNILTITDKKQFVIPYVFEQGEGKGLYDITKTESSGTEIVTRLYPQGGDRNIPIGYKQDALPSDKDRYSPFLLLPNNPDGTIRYYYDDVDAIKKFGIRPKSEKFDYLFPSIYDTRLKDLYPEKLVGESFPSGTIGNDGVNIGGLSGDTRIDGIVGCEPVVESGQEFFSIYTTDLGFFLDQKERYDDEVINVPLGDSVTGRPSSLAPTTVTLRSEYMTIPSETDVTIPGIELLLPKSSVGVVSASFISNNGVKVITYPDHAFGKTDQYYTLPSMSGKTPKTDTRYILMVEFKISSMTDAPTNTPASAYFSSKSISYIKQSTIEYYKYYTSSNAIISMRDGRYAGYDFTVQKDGTKKLEPTDNHYSKGARYSIKLARVDDSGSMLPAVGAPLAANERFVILGINMPKVYETMAENRLLQVSKEYLVKNNYLKNSVSLSIATGFTIENPDVFGKFVAGNVCKVKDEGIDLPEKSLTIESVTVQYTSDTQFPKWSCTLSDVKTYGKFEQLAKDISSTTRTQQSSLALTADSINDLYKKINEAKESTITLVKLNDTEVYDDNNTMSSLRSLFEFISSRKDGDSAAIVNFLNGIKVNGIAIKGILQEATNVEKYSDSDIMSALRVMKEIMGESEELRKIMLRRDQPDSTPFLLSLLGGALVENGLSADRVETGGFIPGLVGGRGAQIKGGTVEARNIVVHESLAVTELMYNKVSVNVGYNWQTNGGGIIESVTMLSPTSGIATLKLEDYEYGAIAVDDLCMGILRQFDDSDNATSTTDDGKGNFTFTGFATSYFRITEILDTVRNSQFSFVLRGKSDNYEKPISPSYMMHFAQFGNITNKARQSSVYSTTTYVRALVDVNSWEYTINNIAAQLYDCSNLSVFGKNMTGRSAYFRNLYMSGTIEQFEDKPLSMDVSFSLGSFMAPNEKGIITANVFDGYGVNVNDQINTWIWERESGDDLADAAWNADHKNLTTTCEITFNDLGINSDLDILTLFRIFASDGVKSVDGTLTL